jgi:PKD repeat protein
MRNTICILLCLITTYHFAWAQHHVDFGIQNQVCKGEYLDIVQNSDPAVAFEWDFCANQLDGIYTGTSRSPAVGSMTDVAVVQEGNEWFGFATSRNHQLVRLNFGDSPGNTYSVTNLGNPGGLLLSPEGISVVKEGDQWVGLVTLLAEHEVVRLSWGEDIRSAPIAQSLNIKGFNKLNNPIQISIAKDGLSTIAAIVNTTGNTVTLINFGSSIFNNPLDGDILVSESFPGAVNMQGVTISKQCDQWFLYTISQNKVFRVSVGLSLFTAITVPQIQDFSSSVPVPIGDFGKIASIDYGGNTYVYLASYTNPDLLALKWSAGNPTPEFKDVSDTSIPPNPFSIEPFNNAGNFGLFVGGFGGGINHIDISSPCYASPRFSTASDPAAFYFTGDGISAVSVTVTFADGVKCALTKNVQVTPDIAPIPVLQKSPAICSNSPITFTAQNNNVETVSTWFWDFQDGTSAQQIADFSFAVAGTKIISLTANGANGCSNTVSTNLTIYDPPVPSFSPPAGLICTNDNITVVNNTPDNFNGNLLYEWLIDGIPVSTTRNLDYKFNSTGTPTVKLVTTVPGCTANTSQELSEIFEGPKVAFSFFGKCEGEDVTFSSAIEGDFTDVTWNFGDGGTSDTMNPTHVFSPGFFSASLTVISPNGCNNSETKLVSIKTKPSPDFFIEGPPSSCSGYASVFTDLTPSVIDGNLESWQWNFADGEADVVQNPSHIFKDDGDYEVELTVTTEDGCSNTIVKTITILQSPTISFENGASCLNKLTSFTASSDDALQYYWEIGTSYYETQNASHVFSSTGSHAVKLSVLGSNDCVSTLIHHVIVPLPVNPVFSVTNNCRDFETKFKFDPDTDDPVITRDWDFAGEGTSPEANPSFTFNAVGDKLITLQVTTASGCVYQRQNLITVIDPPIANFSFTPDFGVPPQEISFINSSSNATSFNWNFDDGGSSSEHSPKHTFTELGDYEVELTASNIADCQASISKVFSMVAPLPDVDLSLMTITPNGDGTSKVIVTIANKGNTFLINLPIRLDVSGSVTLETIVQEAIAPFSMHNLILDFGIAQTETLEFLCASATLAGDLHPEGNRICSQLRSDVAILTPYPNPAKDVLTVEWVAQEDEQVQVKLVDTNGKAAIDFVDASRAGLNQTNLDISRLRSGIYILRIVSPTGTKTHRILISN